MLSSIGGDGNCQPPGRHACTEFDSPLQMTVAGPCTPVCHCDLARSAFAAGCGCWLLSLTLPLRCVHTQIQPPFARLAQEVGWQKASIHATNARAVMLPSRRTARGPASPAASVHNDTHSRQRAWRPWHACMHRLLGDLLQRHSRCTTRACMTAKMGKQDRIVAASIAWETNEGHGS